MSKPRVVVDTSCLISYYLGSRSDARAAIRHLRPSHQFLASTETVDEFREVLLREKFKQISPELRLNFIAEYESFITLIEPQIRLEVCIDPKDDKFLSLAVSGQASLILSDDSHLLRLHPFRGVDILSPAKFLTHQPR